MRYHDKLPVARRLYLHHVVSCRERGCGNGDDLIRDLRGRSTEEEEGREVEGRDIYTRY